MRTFPRKTPPSRRSGSRFSPDQGRRRLPTPSFLTAVEPETTPEGEAGKPEKNRREPNLQEKVPLSDRAMEVPDEIRAAMQAAKPPDEPPEESPSGKGGRIPLMALAAVLVLAVGFLAWSQRDFITGLIPAKSTAKTVKATVPEKPKQVPAPPSTPALETQAASTPSTGASAPVATVRTVPAATPARTATPARAATTAPSVPEPIVLTDPVLSALAGISKVTPPRVWLTSESASSDGVYELKGMSFSHEALQSFASILERKGTITRRDIPAAAKNPEAVYTFHISGKLNDIKTTEILDALPANRLCALGDSLRLMRMEADIQIVRLPKVGKAYAESELPFELEGSYPGLQRTLENFLSKRGIVIDRIFVHPAASGKQFNRVRVSFSLRTISSI